VHTRRCPKMRKVLACLTVITLLIGCTSRPPAVTVGAIRAVSVTPVKPPADGEVENARAAAIRFAESPDVTSEQIDRVLRLMELVLDADRLHHRRQTHRAVNDLHRYIGQSHTGAAP
jgi:hypothetical protein